MENFTEIKLTERQLSIVKNIMEIKEKIQGEINSLSHRETEFIVNLCDAKGVEIAQGIKFEGSSMFVPISKEQNDAELVEVEEVN